MRPLGRFWCEDEGLLQKQLWEEFSVSWNWGFLPPEEPLIILPDSYFAPWEELVKDLPNLLRNKTLRELVDKLPLLDASKLQGRREYQRALTILSQLTSGYVWMENQNPISIIPEQLSIPFVLVSKYFDLPPILTYSSYALWNWKYVHKPSDSEQMRDAFDLDNITMINTFTDSETECWFSTIPLAAEKVCSKVIQNIVLAQKTIEDIQTDVVDSETLQTSVRMFNHNEEKDKTQEDLESTIEDQGSQRNNSWIGTHQEMKIRPHEQDEEYQRFIHQKEMDLLIMMRDLNERIKEIVKIINRIYEKCDPDEFFYNLRPYLSGWKGVSLLPEGVIYSGVSSEPLQYHGSSAAQSSIFSLLDSALDIIHQEEEMSEIKGSQATKSISGGAKNFLEHMKLYMSREHRDFVNHVRECPFSIRNYILNCKSNLSSELVKCFNECVESISLFRRSHMAIAVHYIVSKSRNQQQAARGTGGSEIVSMLKKLRQETDDTKL